VTFWRQLDEATPDSVPWWESDIRRVEGATDVREVIAWAEERAAGRLYMIHAEIAGIDKPMLTQVAGQNPTRQYPPQT
jgi:hypothetical protein